MLPKAHLARLRSLHEKKHRDESGHFVVEGEKVVNELLAAGFRVLELYATPAWRGPPGSPTAVLVSDEEMARISHYPTPSNVFAVLRIDRPALPPDELTRGLTLALDGIQDAGNLGTLLRVADWFGLDRVLCSPDCVDRFNQKAINASMGSFSRVRVFTTSLPEALAGLAPTVPVLGCDLDGTDVHTLAPAGAAVIVIGSEGRGISPAVRALVSAFVTIPRYGAAESLNAGIAAAIVCDNLRRGQRPSAPRAETGT